MGIKRVYKKTASKQPHVEIQNKFYARTDLGYTAMPGEIQNVILSYVRDGYIAMFRIEQYI